MMAELKDPCFIPNVYQLEETLKSVERIPSS